MQGTKTTMVLGCLGLLALTGCYEGLNEGRNVGAAGRAAPSTLELGVVAGGVYTPDSDWFPVEQSMQTHGEAIFCELGETLGAKWIRIEADWQTTSSQDYQRMVRQAHEAGMKVLVLVNDHQCAGETDETFASDLAARVVELATTTFVDDASADAYEILNEPNAGKSDCGGISDFAVSPNAHARALYELRDQLQLHGIDAKIVAGAPLNLGVPDPMQPAGSGNGEPYWVEYLAALQDHSTGPTPPFDYFGIHPYNPWDLLQPEEGCSVDLAHWSAEGAKRIHNLHVHLDAIYDLPSRPLFATEFGFESDHDGDIAACSPQQAAEGMDAAVDMLEGTGLVTAATWYSYRDYVDEHSGQLNAMGLREQFDGTEHPAKTDVWQTFADLAGGQGSAGDPPEACWRRGANLVFDAGDDPSPVEQDWKQYSYKAQCPEGQAARGLSIGTTTGAAHGMLCTPTDPVYQIDHQGGQCYVRTMASGDSPDPIGYDWDFGHFKGQCDPNDVVVGMSQSTDLKVDGILCCPADVGQDHCETLEFIEGDNPHNGTNATGDWSPFYFKNECDAEAGYTIRGVSRDPGTGRPHAIRCCR